MAFRGHGLQCVPGVDILPDSNIGSKRRLSARPRKALALRRRRLCHPLVAGADPFQLARRRLRPRALDCAQRQVLGPDVAIDIDVIDESNTRVNIPKLIRRFRKSRQFGLVGLVGVQSNQYPRALDIARPFRAADIPVVMGGFHVSGCLSMLDGRASTLSCARPGDFACLPARPRAGSTTFCATPRRGALKPIYNYMETAGDRRDADPLPAASTSSAPRHQHELRCRPRLPVSVFVLHHHQRAGPQVAPPLPR